MPTICSLTVTTRKCVRVVHALFGHYMFSANKLLLIANILVEKGYESCQH